MMQITSDKLHWEQEDHCQYLFVTVLINFQGEDFIAPGSVSWCHRIDSYILFLFNLVSHSFKLQTKYRLSRWYFRGKISLQEEVSRSVTVNIIPTKLSLCLPFLFESKLPYTTIFSSLDFLFLFCDQTQQKEIENTSSLGNLIFIEKQGNKF